MASSPRLYTPLPGRGIRRVGFVMSASRCRLWLAPDHLLAVDSTLGAEAYRRFYFRDIEAFIVRRTAWRQISNWIFLTLAILTAGPFLAAWRSQGESGFLMAAVGSAALWSVLILVNSLRGATCAVHARTAAQLELLPSLGRLPNAQRVLTRIRPLIIEAQGAPSAEELAASPWSAPGLAGPEGQGRETLRRSVSKRLHYGLFSALVLQGAITAISYGTHHGAVSTLSILAVLVGAVLAVVALVRQGGSDLPRAACNLTKLALGYYVLVCLIGFIYTVVYAIRHPGQQVVTGVEMTDEPGFPSFALIAGGVSLLLGLAGFVMLRAPRVTHPAPPPTG